VPSRGYLTAKGKEQDKAAAEIGLVVLKWALAGPMSLLLRAPASCWRAPWSVSRSLESVEYREGGGDGPGPTWSSGARETLLRI